MRIGKTIGLLILSIILVSAVLATLYPHIPSSPTTIIHVQNFSKPNISDRMEIGGGNHTILRLDATTPSYSWNVFVGNITGQLGLGDSRQNALYIWNFTIKRGEIIATRDSNNINWTGIRCANRSNIYDEENELNIDTAESDSINNTFTTREHREFILSTVLFEQHECLGIKINSENGTDETYFQEVLLYSGVDILYTGLLEDSIPGFNEKLFDFQIIVPNDKEKEDTAYYFYTELV